ncbi:hypothetical protein Bint_1347 [Brachyspira intermedia PWS/A]|uniref:Uncharacterized protein n=1 Tax=Brachyspira intermedia (strain ATCC 51140 / PWS/A) TaxID=1045858 RepID=G0EP96_BRAIP|nr:hypothetical protein Bint_1347 [Brachyspira intermedia PWS/A]
MFIFSFDILSKSEPNAFELFFALWHIACIIELLVRKDAMIDEVLYALYDSINASVFFINIIPYI